MITYCVQGTELALGHHSDQADNTPDQVYVPVSRMLRGLGSLGFLFLSAGSLRGEKFQPGFEGGLRGTAGLPGRTGSLSEVSNHDLIMGPSAPLSGTPQRRANACRRHGVTGRPTLELSHPASGKGHGEARSPKRRG